MCSSEAGLPSDWASSVLEPPGGLEGSVRLTEPHSQGDDEDQGDDDAHHNQDNLLMRGGGEGKMEGGGE